ncbi:MAG: 50S ribosomal protein L18 [Bryobacterales bacterium]
MYHQTTKREGRQRIHSRIRNRLSGTPERPRLAIFRSLKHIYAQVIDDSTGKTLVAVATVTKGATKDSKAAYGGNAAAAKLIGKQIAEKALKAGIKDVVFDRGGHRYHGRVKALAEAAREAGLRF